MSQITVVGIGPGGDQYLTIEAFKILKNKDKNYFRTIKHPIVETLEKDGITFESFDEYYDKYEEFDQVYESIANKLISLAKSDDIVYAVPGNPFVAEKTVELLIEKAEKLDEITLEFVHGTSFIDAIITSIKKDPVHGLKILNGLELDKYKIDVDVDSIIIQTYDNIVASNVKLKLMEYYSDDHIVTVIRGAGIPGVEKIVNVPLFEMDRLDIMDHLTSVFVPKESKEVNRKYFFEDLISIMKRLRSIDGCPWDREQTHKSLRDSLLEESYEVIEAIEDDDLYLLEEELGDLLLQIVFHSVIANENGYFNIHDVTTGISKKLINRHPHVFGDIDVKDSDEVLKNWEIIKKEEKNEKTTTDSMKRIAKTLPSLVRATKVQKKAKEVGFDWDKVEDAILKITEELDEFNEIRNRGNHNRIGEELGDLLFSVVNVCRFYKVNPEFALKETTEKFIRRFNFVEDSILAKDGKMEEISLKELDNLWNKAKKQENL
ncbi:bifunctional methyltransferase/pyrophosphohydrolase YabN [Helicovermis profundi]|uniref:Nucleoside triphosphate pyrophosphohydrolase n=1 Tax=Helicovermis profundi TaxID=3065157 RepID=A0AAU9EJ14_9FIRM|nr:nucleoside triphosphate pyrophosphohydrolase [Clostridia bacterium S502]